MAFDRRLFLKQAGLASISPFLISALNACNSSGKTEQSSENKTGSFDKFGLQLWTVKDAMAKDPKGTLQSLASYGYNQIESYAGDNGIFWGMKPTEFLKFTTDLNLDVYGSHCDPEFSIKPEKMDAFKKLVDEAAEAKMKYLINPYVGMLKTLDEFKKVADTFNKQGEICKAAGIRYGYHNHHYSFKQVDGQFPQDIMMKGTDANLMDFEMDIYWVVAAGQNPEEWLKKYPNRFKLFHVKDRHKQERIAEIEKTEKADPNFGVDASCVLGTGQINFSQVLKVAKENGGEYFAVEQERYDNSDSMKDAKLDAEYMKILKID